MDQPTLTNEYYMTREFLEKQIAALSESIQKKDALIVSLQDRSSEMSQNVYKAHNATQSMRDAMHEWTMKELADNGITEDQANEIAEICEFELTKEVEVEVSVTYNLTLQVPYDEDVDSIVNDIDFESVSYNSDNITWLSASVDRIDF
jgi:putative lipase involved disintegration of autophagic bodies